MGHTHTHGSAAARSGARYRHRLLLVLLLALALLVAQVVVGLVTNSLALLSDAGHVATDALGLGLALAAITAAGRAGGHPSRTYGLYRLEVVAALGNALLLLAVAGWVLVEAASRWSEPPDIPGGPVVVMGAVGLAVNFGSVILLRRGARESLNVAGAYLEVLADLFGSVAVLASGAVTALTEVGWVDPLAGATIGVLIAPRAVRLGWEALRVLIQVAPRAVDIDRLRHDLLELPDVVDVHDLHVWTLTSEMEVLSAHVMVRTGADTHATLDRARHLLAERHGLRHATLQIEPEDHTGCEEVDW